MLLITAAPARDPDAERDVPRGLRLARQSKVLVEFDGAVHREQGVFVQDLRRQNALVAAGWTVLRFSSADVLRRPEEVVAAILRALGV